MYVWKQHAYTRSLKTYEKKIKPALFAAGWESVVVRLKNGAYMIAIAKSALSTLPQAEVRQGRDEVERFQE
jgi:hypothetical protein